MNPAARWSQRAAFFDRHFCPGCRRLDKPANLANSDAMITVNVLAAKTNLSRLLSQMEKRGEPVLICRNGKPVVEI